MIVCGHGDVADFCAARDMVICEEHTGDIEEYSGRCCVLVTDQDMGKNEYYRLKRTMFQRGIELISVHHTDNPEMMSFIAYDASQRRPKTGGRVRFGYQRVNGEIVEHPEEMKVVRRIWELRAAKKTLREIQEDPQVRYLDGSKMGVSMIQSIIARK